MYSTYNESEHNILARPTKAKFSLLLSVSSVSLHALFQNNFCFKKKQKQKSGNLAPLVPSQKKIHRIRFEIDFFPGTDDDDDGSADRQTDRVIVVIFSPHKHNNQSANQL